MFKPYCKVNVINDTSTTELGAVPNTWIKANFSQTIISWGPGTFKVICFQGFYNIAQ